MGLKSLLPGLKHAARGALYHSGAYGLCHRLRNRRTLTTFMFHRVLPAGSAELALAEREFSFTVDGFARCLDFIQAHYNVVGLSAIRQAQAGGKELPDRAALITFDDGWRDTLVHASPELARRGLSAALFVSSEVLLSGIDRWWQDQLVSIQQDPSARRKLEIALREKHGAIWGEAPPGDRQLSAAVAALPESARFDLFAGVAPAPQMARQMLTLQDIHQARGGCIEMGAHGHSHAPLTLVAKPDQELGQSYALISEHWPWAVASMSFPHGAYDASLVALAQQAGFELIFTSDPTLNTTRPAAAKPATLGRIHIPENQWTCQHGKVSFPRLATYLFFRPVA